MKIKNFINKAFRCLTISLLFLSYSVPAFAGAIAEGEEEDYFTCDKRRMIKEESSLDFCTTQTKKSIGESCFVVIHQIPLTGRKCSWQGCGAFSLIGKPAKLTENASKFIEYAIRSPRDNAPFADAPNGKGVLPKHPYPRHYLTVKEANDALNACPGNPLNLPEAVRAAVCNTDRDIIRLNPYWNCYISN